MSAGPAAPAGRSDAPSHLAVSEIFISIQGEATHSGRPCAFVRLAGCDLRCRWCDTEYAFHGGTPMTVAEILDRVASFGCPLVQVTGGEPLLHPGAPPLVIALLDVGYEVLVETGGHRDLSVLDRRAHIVMDLKAPGSGEHEHNRWQNVALLSHRDALKFVVADRVDYEWSREAIRARRLDERCPVYFSPVHGELSASALAGWILEDRLPVRLQVQLHKLLWGASTRGV